MLKNDRRYKPNSNSTARKYGFAKILAVLAYTICAVNLIGWALDLPNLSALLPGAPQMSLISNFTIFSLASSLIAIMGMQTRVQRKTYLWIARIFSGIVAFMAIQTLFEFIFDFRAAIQVIILNSDPRTAFHGLAARLSPQGGLCGITLALALLLYSTQKPRQSEKFFAVFQTCAFIAITFSGLALISYICGINSLYSLSPYTGLSVPTATGFMLVAWGILALEPQQGFLEMLRKRNPAGMFLRRFSVTSVILMTTLAVVIRLGEHLDYYPISIALSLFVVVTLFSFLVLAHKTAQTIERNAEQNLILEENKLSTLKAQLQHQARERELLHSKQQAEEVSTLKSAFLANMSHEIRTPLGAILGYVELTEDAQTGPDEKSSFLKNIQRNAQQLSELINDILDLSKIEAGQLKVEPQRCDLVELVRDVVAILGIGAKNKNLQLTWELSPEVPRFIGTDPLRLKQVLINVIGNAIKFTAQGSIGLEVRQSESQQIVFAIHDTGIGISEKQMAALFRPFSQADSTITRRFGGTGLGLALSRKLGIALGGDLILARSTPGAGSTFELTIRNLPVSAEQMPELKSVPPATGKDLLRNLRVLMVDDSLDNQDFVSLMLIKQGANVQFADNGEIALDKVRREDFDLVLMDLQMPILDGYATTQQLRLNGFRKPIIALSAHTTKETRNKSFAAGCDGFLGKPFRRQELVSLVASLSH